MIPGFGLLDSPYGKYQYPRPFPGAVAQLGERDVRNVEVSGSIPLGSTNLSPIIKCLPGTPFAALRQKPLSEALRKQELRALLSIRNLELDLPQVFRVQASLSLIKSEHWLDSQQLSCPENI